MEVVMKYLKEAFLCDCCGVTDDYEVIYPIASIVESKKVKFDEDWEHICLQCLKEMNEKEDSV
jgi:hypothetical protein